MYKPFVTVICWLSQGYFQYQVWPLWNNSFLSYLADKQKNQQTESQTDADERLTHATAVGVSNSDCPNVL